MFTDGLDVNIIHATVRGWVLAHILNAPLTVQRVMAELGMSERQASLGLAEAQTSGIVKSVGAGEWNRTSMTPGT